MNRQSIAKNLDAVDESPTPTFSALWAPVYWEPMISSGERITAIIGVLGDDGEVLSSQVLRKEIIKTLYKEKAESVEDMLSWLSASLGSHLVDAKTFEGWEPPFGGAQLGVPRAALDADIDGVLLQGIRMSASLSMLATEDFSSARESRQNDRWKTSIESIVLQSSPTLKDAFWREFKITADARPTVIDFVGTRIAANFARLHISGLSRHIKDAKSQLVDLASLRDRFTLLKHEEQYRLMLWKPSAATNFELSDGQLETMNAAFEELKAEGDKLGLYVKDYETPMHAANEIIHYEMAA